MTIKNASNKDEARLIFGSEDSNLYKSFEMQINDSQCYTISEITDKLDSSKLWTIKKVVNSYFSVVTKAFRSSIPKYIIHFMIDKITQEVKSGLKNALFDHEDLDSLLEEDNNAKKLRKKGHDNINKLRKAKLLIKDIQERIQDQNEEEYQFYNIS